MADKGHQGFTDADEERRRGNVHEGGHGSHEKGATREFDTQADVESERKGSQARQMTHAARAATGMSGAHASSAEGPGHQGETAHEGGRGGEAAGAEQGTSAEPTGERRSKKTRGGTHDQHVSAGKKGGSRIRELIELGYKYEEEHGIGPGRNERSKIAARRRAVKATGAQGGANKEAEGGPSEISGTANE
jgi:hypothetical protein